MKDLLAVLAGYLATKTSKTLGVDVFYNEMPDKVNECICVYEVKTNIGVAPQIDALVHRVTVGIRSSSNLLASDLAYKCYTAMLGDEETPGFIPLSNGGTIYVWLHGPPVWEKADTQGRKYYTFGATITTKR